MKVDFEFLSDEQIYRKLMREEIPSARESVFIATALVKQTQIEITKGEFGPFIQLVDDLIRRRVSVSILLAGKPSKSFMDSIARFPRVAAALQFRVCARNHMKIVLIDNARLYLGSANLTGAGMGRKSNDRRNFEFGLYTTDPRLIRRVSGMAEEIWLQKPCRSLSGHPALRIRAPPDSSRARDDRHDPEQLVFPARLAGRDSAFRRGRSGPEAPADARQLTRRGTVVALSVGGR